MLTKPWVGGAVLLLLVLAGCGTSTPQAVERTTTTPAPTTTTAAPTTSTTSPEQIDAFSGEVLPPGVACGNHTCSDGNPRGRPGLNTPTEPQPSQVCVRESDANILSGLREGSQSALGRCPTQEEEQRFLREYRAREVPYCYPVGVSGSYHRDLDCSDFSIRNFRTPPGDPDGLDADNDGIACET